MVSETVALAGAIAFLVLFTGPLVYLAWMSYRDERHSPAALRDDEAETDVESV
jgi:hypothetical protein